MTAATCNQLQNPAGAKIRSTQGNARRAVPETGQSPVGTAPTPSDRTRRDALVRKLAPGTVRKLEIELTPARAARLDIFELTTGLSAKALFLAWLDDEIFSVRS